MLKAGEVAEGYHTLELLMKYLRSADRNMIEKLPLLRAVEGVIFGGKNAREELRGFTEQRYETF